MPLSIKNVFKSFWFYSLATLLLLSAALYALLLYQRGPSLGGDFTLTGPSQKWVFSEQAKSLNLLYFGYSRCPDVCPMALSFAGQAFRQLAPEDLASLRFIFVSVDTANDTIESAALYARHFHANFEGVTGLAEEVDRAIKLFGASYIIEENPKSYLKYSIAHTDRIFFLDKNGKVVDSLGSPKSPEEIVTKIRENL